MLNILIKPFSGIKEFQFTINTNPTTFLLENFTISGFLNKSNEKISFLKEITFSYKDSLNKLPVFSLMNSLEENSINSLKSNIYKNLLNYSKNNYDFIVLWKNFINKTVLNQTALLLNNLCFFYDVSVIMASFQNADDIQVNLMGFLETIKTGFNLFLKFIRESKFNENSQKSINFEFFAQFTLQILNFLEIVKFFISKKIENIASFDYFSLPKFSFEINRTSFEQSANKNSNVFFNQIKEKTRNLIQNYVYSTMPNLAGNSDFFNFIAANYNKENISIDISMICFNYKLNYGYEISDYTGKFYPNLISEKIIVSVATAFTMMDAILIKGPSATGKQETLKVFS